ncbi:potassium channel family protein [Litchfieldia salsa]|uniref:Voltage-gated potassium channel n=1 Tax=Litchfieldia salsa TaxID=930152 RepID=A0A1H0WYS5_9BACI|nr:potassium channel family protein [Litchfieldia salsa]SDP95739.1 voltage-gated potassium channel [Litchfieldia salsa]
MKTTSLIANFLRWPIILRILMIIILVTFLFGSMIHLIEPYNFPTIFDGIWWAIVTTSTVGFGDFVPTSITGRAVAILLILVGTGFVTIYFVTLSTAAVTNQNAYIEGKISYHGNQHIIIIGWNERVKETISQIKEIDPQMDIILIDETLETNPFPSNHFHFIRGKPFNDEVLIKAKAEEASTILITSDQSKDEVQADMSAVLTLLAVKGINPHIYSIIEILTFNQVKNAERAGADEIIQTNKLTSSVMINSLVSHGMSNALSQMLDQLRGSKLTYLEITFDLVGKTFGECSRLLLQEKKLLIGIKRGGQTMVNPDFNIEIEKQDKLLVIKD